jgi:hypothetical protein
MSAEAQEQRRRMGDLKAMINNLRVVADSISCVVPSASLAGASMCGSCGSPSADRARQMEALMGLGYSYSAAGSKADQYCSATYPKGATAQQDEYNRLCMIAKSAIGPYFDPWTTLGKQERGLPIDWVAVVKGAEKDVGQAQKYFDKARSEVQQFAQGSGGDAPSSVTPSVRAMTPAQTQAYLTQRRAPSVRDAAFIPLQRDGGSSTTVMEPVTPAAPPPPPTTGGSSAKALGGVAAVAVLGFVAMKMLKK